MEQRHGNQTADAPMDSALLEAFREWIDDDFVAGIAVRHEHGRWFALWLATLT